MTTIGQQKQRHHSVVSPYSLYLLVSKSVGLMEISTDSVFVCVCARACVRASHRAPLALIAGSFGFMTPQRVDRAAAEKRLFLFL